MKLSGSTVILAGSRNQIAPKAGKDNADDVQGKIHLLFRRLMHG